MPLQPSRSVWTAGACSRFQTRPPHRERPQLLVPLVHIEPWHFSPLRLLFVPVFLCVLRAKQNIGKSGKYRTIRPSNGLIWSIRSDCAKLPAKASPAPGDAELDRRTAVPPLPNLKI